MSYTLHIPGKLPDLNDIIAASKGCGGKGYNYSKMKKAWTNSIALIARGARIPHLTRVRFHFHWHEKDRSRNKDNVAGGGRKFILDGLVLAKVLDNDGWKQIADDWTDTFTADRSYGVTVTLEPVP